MTSSITPNTSTNLVVADSSPLIAIAIMDLFPILNKLFEQVIVSQAVVKECLCDLSKAQSMAIQQALQHKWITERKVRNTEYCHLLGQILDPGEAEAITLAKELNATALIDEKAGRKVAHREGLICIGSLYVLIKAKQAGLIQSVIPLINRLIAHGYYLDQKLIDTVLEVSNEYNKL